MPEIKVAPKIVPRIIPLTASARIQQELSEILVETVASGGSVSFMHPLAVETADAFWQGALASADRGEKSFSAPLTTRA